MLPKYMPTLCVVRPVRPGPAPPSLAARRSNSPPPPHPPLWALRPPPHPPVVRENSQHEAHVYKIDESGVSETLGLASYISIASIPPHPNQSTHAHCLSLPRPPWPCPRTALRGRPARPRAGPCGPTLCSSPACAAPAPDHMGTHQVQHFTSPGFTFSHTSKGWVLFL